MVKSVVTCEFGKALHLFQLTNYINETKHIQINYILKYNLLHLMSKNFKNINKNKVATLILYGKKLHHSFLMFVVKLVSNILNTIKKLSNF